MKYITNAHAIILILSDNTNVRVLKTDKNYPKILKTFELPQDEQESAIKKILSPTIVGKSAVKSVDGFDVIDDQIFYDGEQLPKALETKVLSIMKDGLPLTHFQKFWENLKENPSFHVVNESGFYDFLEYKELPLTEDGCFMAYRGVKDDYYSKSGSLTTKVIQGKVNSSGQIYNGVGEVIEVARRGVSDNRDVYCHEGSLHIGSLDYARGWAGKLVLVKVNPKDVVSVPRDCDAQKCRVCKYEVVGDFKEEITSSVVDDELNELNDEDGKEWDDTLVKIATYLENKTFDGVTEVTIRQIQNTFSPGWISKDRVLAALQELWYDWDERDGVIYVILD